MDSRTKSDIQRLTKKRPTIAPLGNASDPDSIPAQTGTGSPRGVSVSGGGGGIASPLTETDASTRTYHPAASAYLSSDGLWVFYISQPNEINMTDANSNPVQLVFDAP